MANIRHYWLAECAACKHIGEKRNMRRIFTEKERYATPTILFYLCEGCFLTMLDKLEVSL